MNNISYNICIVTVYIFTDIQVLEILVKYKWHNILSRTTNEVIFKLSFDSSDIFKLLKASADFNLCGCIYLIMYVLFIINSIWN